MKPIALPLWTALVFLAALAPAQTRAGELDDLLAAMRGVRACIRSAQFEEVRTVMETSPTGGGTTYACTMSVLFSREPGRLRAEVLSATPTGRPDLRTRPWASGVTPRPFPGFRMVRQADMEPVEVFGLPEFLSRRDVKVRRVEGGTVVEARSAGAGRRSMTEVRFDARRLPLRLRRYDAAGRLFRTVEVTWQRVDACWFPQEVRVTTTSAGGTTRNVTVRKGIRLNVPVTSGMLEGQP